MPILKDTRWTPGNHVFDPKQLKAPNLPSLQKPDPKYRIRWKTVGSVANEHTISWLAIEEKKALLFFSWWSEVPISKKRHIKNFEEAERTLGDIISGKKKTDPDCRFYDERGRKL